MQQLDHHPLAAEFPEFKEQIHVLKSDNAHFARLFGDYEMVDKEIVRIEAGNEAASDVVLENMKKQRLALKDELYAMLKASEATA